MFFNKVHQPPSPVTTESSQQVQPTPLWNQLTNTEQEVTKGGFGFPGFPGFPGGPARPGVAKNNPRA